MEGVVGSEEWPFKVLFAMLFATLFEVLFEMLFEMLFGLVPVLSCGWASAKVTEPLSRSAPESRPVQCERVSNPSPRGLKLTNVGSSGKSVPPFQLPPSPCPSPLSTSIIGSGGSVMPRGAEPDSENVFHGCFPCRLEGLYEQVKLFVQQRSHVGRFLSHLTLAAEQASQVVRSREGALDSDIDLAGPRDVSRRLYDTRGLKD